MQSKGIDSAKKRTIDLRNYFVYIAAACIFVFFAITISQYGFLTPNNLMNIIRTTTMISVMATAMTFVIAAGEIDLSIGSVTAFSSLIAALLMQADVPWILAAIVGIGSGIGIGAVNGALVTRLRIPSFLVTLGMMQLLRGVDMWMTATQPIVILDMDFNNIFGTGNVGPISSLAVWTIIAVIVGHIMLKKTTFGRKILATGGNRVSAEYSGINTKKIKTIALMTMGGAAAISGLLYSGMMQSARYSFGTGDELSVLAAVMIGGTSLAGGNGSVVGTLIGSLMIGMINNGLIILGLDVSQQMVVSGAIIILSVAVSRKPNVM